MPPLRNLLGRKPTVPENEGKENNARAQSRLSVDSQHSGPLSFRKSREEVPNEYKMCGTSGVATLHHPKYRKELTRHCTSGQRQWRLSTGIIISCLISEVHQLLTMATA